MEGVWTLPVTAQVMITLSARFTAATFPASRHATFEIRSL
jgi:hypothetical protein